MTVVQLQKRKPTLRDEVNDLLTELAKGKPIGAYIVVVLANGTRVLRTVGDVEVSSALTELMKF